MPDENELQLSTLVLNFVKRVLVTRLMRGWTKQQTEPVLAVQASFSVWTNGTRIEGKGRANAKRNEVYGVFLTIIPTYLVTYVDT